MPLCSDISRGVKAETRLLLHSTWHDLTISYTARFALLRHVKERPECAIA